ncbi:MAG: hypothetical protein ACK5LS_10565 [Propioniciclava sp.]
MNRAWNSAIAFALVGEELVLPETETPDLAALPAQLASHGWDHGRLQDQARRAGDQGCWPFPIPRPLRAGLGAAQLRSAIQAARAALGVDTLTVLPPSRRTGLTADERRLLNDVPPHYQ